MKILYLIPHLFIPPKLGNTYLIYNLLRYVTEHADCDLALLVDKGIDNEDAVRTIRTHFKSVGEILIFDKPRGFERLWARIRSLISGYHQAVGNYWSEPLAKWLQERTAERHYDIIHFDMFYMTSYIPYCKNVRTVLVPSDAYSLAALNVYRGTKDIRYKARFLLEYLIMSNCERRMYYKFDVVCPVAETDSRYLSTKVKHSRFKTVGVAVGKDYVSVKPISYEDNYSNCELLYMGPLALPWVAAYMIRFIKNAYPKIRIQVPDVRLTILGKQPTPTLLKLVAADKSIKHVDFVEDYLEFLNRDWVYIHPQHGSAGYKTKIQQVMALGLPVVGSELAFSGMDVVSGEHCYICKTQNEFTESIIKLLLDSALRKRVGLVAAKQIRETYSIEKVGEAMMKVYRGVLIR